MSRRRYKPEQIIGVLRGGEVGFSRGLKLGQICRMLPLVFMIAILDHSTAVPDNGRPLNGFHGRSFSLYVLSRGKGVPDAAWRVLKQMRQMFASRQAEGVMVQVHETRIGLEGERRLCAEFIDEATARAAWCRAEAIIAGVELVNLRAGPCSP